MSFSATASTASKGGGDGKGKQDGGERKNDGTGFSLLTLPDELLLAILEQVNLDWRHALTKKGGLNGMNVNKRIYRLARIVRYRQFGVRYTGPLQADLFAALFQHHDIQPMVQDLTYTFNKTYIKYDGRLIQSLSNLRRLDVRHGGKLGETILPKALTSLISKLANISSLHLRGYHGPLQMEDTTWEFSEHLPRLRTLALSFMENGPAVWDLLAHLPVTLTSLQLDVQGLDSFIYDLIPWSGLSFLGLQEFSADRLSHADALIYSLQSGVTAAESGLCPALPLRTLELGPNLLAPRSEPGALDSELTNDRLVSLFKVLEHINLFELRLGTPCEGFCWKEPPSVRVPLQSLVLTASDMYTSLDTPSQFHDLCRLLKFFPSLQFFTYKRFYLSEPDMSGETSALTAPPDDFIAAYPLAIALLAFLKIASHVRRVQWVPASESVAICWARDGDEEDFLLEKRYEADE